ncbi:hypothetical protein LTR08_003399 [Meristemomyces frigidus]|nr:hypothetical protein LTR08_003399 [Meristemomyces frigidus]
MAVPRVHDPVPPPLPPPSYIPGITSGQDPGWQWGNDPAGSDFGRPASVKAGSSLLGGITNGFRPAGQERDFYTQHAVNAARRGSSISTVTLGREHDMADATSDDDGSVSRRSSIYRLQSERQLEQRTLEESSNTYDKQLLSRIGGPNAPKRQSVSYPPGAQELAQLSHVEYERRNSQLRPLSLPERRHASTNSVDSLVSLRRPSSGAVSPGFTGFWAEHGPPDHRAPATRRGSIMFDDSASHVGNYEQSMFLHEDPIEDGQMSNLNLHDRSPSGSDDSHLKAGSKRRASSPPREGSRQERSSISSASGHNEIYHRRSMQQLPSRGSPVSRFHPSHSSVSSASSLGYRHGSLGSSLGIPSIPSSATSYGSGRRSPGAPFSATDPDGRHSSPCGSAKVLPTAHQRTFSKTTQSDRRLSTDSMRHSRHDSLSHTQGTYLCECCPKKPKKFDTDEELRLHESEKQYTCAYCPNRFKNKNEAERHQNSLHLRRQSWSCAAMAGAEAAFHTSQTSNSADVCGYCGEEFPNPPQWDVRAEHLNVVHKFGECNQAKKFFRADHFRQHLKHSHAGTSGKWTNLLETACMKEEPAPERRNSVATVMASGVLAHTALVVTTTGLPGTPHGVIAETPHDK